MLTRLMALAAIVVLVVPIVSHSSPDSRITASIVVSVSALVLAFRAFALSRFVWGLVFLGVLGAFTPFRPEVFSPALVLTLNLVALALFAVSPVILKKSKAPVMSGGDASR